MEPGRDKRGSGFRNLLEGPTSTQVVSFLKRYRFWLVLAGLGLGCSMMLAYATANGVGLSPDSVSYLAAARQVGVGKSMSTWYPPAYPWALACLGATFESARWLNIALLAVLIVAVGGGVYRVTGRSLLAVLAVLLVGASPVMSQIFLMAWSEPLCITSGTLGLVLWSADTQRRSTAGPPPWPTLQEVAGIALMGLSALTRYAGLSYALTALVICRKGKRLRSALGVAVGACLPLFCWLVLDMGSGSEAPRPFAFHFPGPAHWWKFCVSVRDWINPRNPLRVNAWSVAVGLLVLVSVFLGRRAATLAGSLFGLGMSLYTLWLGWCLVGEGSRPLVILGLGVGGGWLLASQAVDSKNNEPPSSDGQIPFLLVYSAFILAANCWFEYAVCYDNRTLSPLWVALAMAFCSHLSELPRVVRAALGCALALWLATAWSVQWPILQANRVDPWGYSGRFWRESALVRAVGQLPQGTLLYSNDPNPFLVNLAPGRKVIYLKGRWDFTANRQDSRFSERLQALKADLQAQGGYLAYVYPNHSSACQDPEEAELGALLQWQRTCQTPEGSLYYVPAVGTHTNLKDH